MARPISVLGLALWLGALGLLALAYPSPARAAEEYTRRLDQPCIACHTTGVSADLNARGRAFAAASTHKAESEAAWADAVRAVPLPPSSGDGASVLVPIAVAGLLAAWAYTMLRRRGRGARPG